MSQRNPPTNKYSQTTAEVFLLGVEKRIIQYNTIENIPESQTYQHVHKFASGKDLLKEKS